MVCRKRSCYDTRNCFIDSLASRLHILQFVTWPISIFQADVDKNPSAPHTRLHFVMTWRMQGEEGGWEGQPPLPLLSPAVLLLLHGEGRWRKELNPALHWPWVLLVSIMSPKELPPWIPLPILGQATSGTMVLIHWQGGSDDEETAHPEVNSWLDPSLFTLQ